MKIYDRFDWKKGGGWRGFEFQQKLYEALLHEAV